MSTFRGLELAKQALFTQQSGLYTTGHNIANANTEGYSRQRVNFETSLATPNASRNRQEIPGQIGTGVQAGSVQRIRNAFLDVQFRAENSKSGYYETRNEALSRLENLLNEPSDTGLSASMNQFWQSLQDLAVNPENSGAKSVVYQRGKALADTFNYLSNSLNNIRNDIQNQMEVTMKEANTILDEINNINQEVRNLETHGYTANDLYDKRDVLLDQLSEIVPIKVEYEDKQGIGDGVASVTLVDGKGEPITKLIDGTTNSVSYFQKTEKNASEEFSYNENYNGGLSVVSEISIGGQSVPVDKLIGDSGSLSGYLDSFGYVENGEVKGDFPTFLSQLDKMAYTFVNEFNEVHGGNDFFGFSEGFIESEEGHGAAGAISVVLEGPDEINVGIDPESGSGNGEVARKLSDVFYKELPGLDNSSMMSFYESVIGDLGVIAEHVNRMNDNTNVLKSQVENQRMAVSSVSIDEELTNMLKFQHAYNAAARSMTATDELLDRIINSMGLVGR